MCISLNCLLRGLYDVIYGDLFTLSMDWVSALICLELFV